MYVVAPDALHKANVSGGEAYMIALPAAVADAAVEEEPHGVNFVEYLRIAIAGADFRAGSRPRIPARELEACAAA